VFEKDTDAYARDRDAEVTKLAKEAGVEVITRIGRTLYDPDELVKKNGNKPTMSMSQVQKAAATLGEPAKPTPAPTSLPDPGDVDLSSIDHEIPSPEPDFNAAHRTAGKENQYKSIMGPNKDFAVPTLAEMGIPAATTPIRGGETLALSELAALCSDSLYIGTFEKPKSAPTEFEPQSTTLLSPHLHFGSLSVREFWWRVQDVIAERKKMKQHVSDIPVNLPGQLLFRDMYFGAQAALGYAFAQEPGNKICRFVDWHLRSSVSPTPVSEHMLQGTYTVDSPQAEEWFRRWKFGKTGFPWIDALMRQLRLEGWIHHLGRHAVACFLTRGGCYVHWERGAEVFEEWLVDHETACNVGNWMWLSCTAFFSMFYRVYSPVAFGRKTDVEGKFVKRFVPELENYDKKYIYEPWKAPIADQKRWGCLIKGGSSVEEEGGMKVYPKPMFDFNERRQVCIDKLKKAYSLGMYGDDERVKDGRWKKIFGYKDESGGMTNDETKGVVNGERNGRKRGREDQDDGEDGGDGSEEEVEEKPKPKETPAKGGKKQATLDVHMTRRK
jgi:cryptochrome